MFKTSEKNYNKNRRKSVITKQKFEILFLNIHDR